MEQREKELFIFLAWFDTKVYLKEIIPINILENFRNDGTQILEIEEIATEHGELDEGKPNNDFDLSPIDIMDEKLKLIHILK